MKKIYLLITALSTLTVLNSQTYFETNLICSSESLFITKNEHKVSVNNEFISNTQNLNANEIYPLMEVSYTLYETEELLESLCNCFYMLDKNDKELRPVIASLVKEHPDNEIMKFISGKNHMNLGNYANALEVFSGLMFSENFEIMDQARYYFALISVYLDNTDQAAISLLNDITQDEMSEYQALAGDMLLFL